MIKRGLFQPTRWLASSLAVCLLFTSNSFSQDDKGIEPNNFDRNVRPQDDLYRAVNGTWLDDTEIPDDKSNYGSFSVLADNAEIQVHKIMQACRDADTTPGSNAQKIGDFYLSFMNLKSIEAKGIDPIKEELARIDQIVNHAQVVEHFGYFNKIGVSSPCGCGVLVDNKDSSRYLTGVIQAGISMPDRDYYLKEEERFDEAKQALKTYINVLFVATGSPAGTEKAEGILELEKKIAEIQWSRTELRDANKRYNLYEVADLDKLAKDIPWNSFFKQVGVDGIKQINVMTPSFFEGLNTVLMETPLEVWRDYLKYQLLDAFAPFGPKTLVDAHFEFHDKTLGGVPEQKVRWKKAVETIGSRGALGDAIGELYVQKHFPEENKAKMDKLVNNLLSAFGQSIDELTWMTDTTKEKARGKLGKITTKIGYPDVWRDFSELEIVPDDLFKNVTNVIEFEHNRTVSRLNGPVDREEWGMNPYTVNAYYRPSMNEIVFPAAILQPPFFNVEADDAVNYGGIGAVIGHEISHAFDDQGSKFDGDGNLNNWWTDEDRAAFSALTEKLIAQYEQYEALPGKTVNGQLTLGENIADLSGLAIAFKAYQISLEGQESPTIAGWSGNQRVFLGWSQVWRRKYREAEMVRRLLTDSHSPSSFRANGPVTNIDAFYEAFEVQNGDKLYKAPADRIKIW